MQAHRATVPARLPSRVAAGNASTGGDWDDDPVTVRARKKELRAGLLAARRDLSVSTRAAAAASLTAAVLNLPEVLAAGTVAAYVSIGTEPATAEVLNVLQSRKVRVLLPVVRDDLDLDWAIYENRAQLSPERLGLLTPVGPRLGLEGIAAADLVLVPALAVAEDGTRLGRGGGCYDRALQRVRPGVPVVALLHDGELLPAVPAEPHDRKVSAVVTPQGVRRLGDGAG